MRWLTGPPLTDARSPVTEKIGQRACRRPSDQRTGKVLAINRCSLLCRDGRREQESLGTQATNIPQAGGSFEGLDPFAGDGHAEGLGQGRDPFHQFSILLVGHDIVDAVSLSILRTSTGYLRKYDSEPYPVPKSSSAIAAPRP